MENKKFYFSALVMCVIMVIIFIIQSFVPGFTEDFVLNALVSAQPWRLVTAIFLHGSVLHLLSNMFALGLFGSILEKIIGTKHFLVLFFLTGIIASFVASFFYPASLGASGAIFGLLGVLAALRPKMVVWTYGVPMPMFVAVAFWFVLDLAGAFFPGSIANIAHIAGLTAGVVVGLIMRPAISAKEKADKKQEQTVSQKELEKWEDEWM